MRITPRFLKRSFVVIIIVMFSLPLMLYYMENGSEENVKVSRRKKLNKFRNSHPGIKDVGHGNWTKLVDGKNSIDFHEPDLGPTFFGPRAVFRKGVIGNYEPTAAEKSGPGEGGRAVHLSAVEMSIVDYGFNMKVSDKISLDRTVPDTRLDECRYWQYPEELPTASVVVVFHNEGFSALMRTVHSVINQSPARLLHEVVLVDDFSDKVNLKSHLDEYITRFDGKVKLYRNNERMGLIMTRTMGARYATGDVVIFLDAHCECGPNWLPPLLSRIAYDRTILAVPVIDSIDWNTFKYDPVYSHGEHFRGIFEWGFLYKESKVPRDVLEEREYKSEPYPAPTHAGGLFAIDRRYFFEVGAYDPGLQIWGGENFELSFKIWQCGGSVEWVPCSRVGHVYRSHMPYGFGKLASTKIPVILLNYMRVVEVWLDPEHREYFYTREPTIRGYPIGNISAQLEFKRAHRCRSFAWFLENVAPEVLENFPAPPPNVAWGEIKLRNSPNNDLCWDTRGVSPNSGPIGLSNCHHFGGNQMFRLNMKGQMATGERCLEPTSWNKAIRITICPVQPTGTWSYDRETGLIREGRSKLCATADPSSLELLLKSCDNGDRNQQFDIKEIKTW